MTENAEEDIEVPADPTTVALTIAAVIVVSGIAVGLIVDPLIIDKIKSKIKKVRH